MTPQGYFMQIGDLDGKIRTRKGERNSILDTVRGTAPSKKTVNDVIVYNDDVNEYVDELVRLKIQIADEIMSLEKYTHQMVLRERYIRLKSWEDIAEEQRYDLGWVYRLHNQALDRFSEIYSEMFERVEE